MQEPVYPAPLRQQPTGMMCASDHLQLKTYN